MSVKSFINVAAIAAVTGLAVSSATATITIPTVPIGNPGNAPDTRVMDDGTTGYGSVAYRYNIATTEVTNTQYAAFLNAVAATDPDGLNGLYNSEMDTQFGGITRSGSQGSYTYSVVAGRASHPVVGVNFWDATRFANWLHNGQPAGPQGVGTTDTGAYTLTENGINNNTITRNPGAQWAVTNENEWYKAAYHQPASQGGPTGDYWLYPTQSDTISLAQANYEGNGLNNTRPVGSYAPNFYGAFDMGGNLVEWNESIQFDINRGLRGGSWLVPSPDRLQADMRSSRFADGGSITVGFRVVQIPGPSSVALLAIGGLLTSRRRRAGGSF